MQGLNSRIPFTQAQFVTSAFKQNSFPKMSTHSGPMPEVVIVGRSNVGKSSLINHLLKNNLAKTSSVPGKTQSINFFAVDEQVALVDLPGYGYAKAPTQLRKQWAEIIDDYLQNRSTLQLILLLIDSRRQPSEEDCAFIEWALFHRKPILFIFTKTDKLNEIEKQKNTSLSLDFLEKHLNLAARSIHFLHYSIKDPSARIRLIKKINELLWA